MIYATDKFNKKVTDVSILEKIEKEVPDVVYVGNGSNINNCIPFFSCNLNAAKTHFCEMPAILKLFHDNQDNRLHLLQTRHACIQIPVNVGSVEYYVYCYAIKTEFELQKFEAVIKEHKLFFVNNSMLRHVELEAASYPNPLYKK